VRDGDNDAALAGGNAMHVTARDVDPDLRASARIMRFISRPNRSEASLRRPSWFLELARRLPGPRGLQVEERWIPRPDGSRIRIRVYRAARRTAPGPGILWLHGGGYVMGSPEQDGSTYRRIVEATGGTVVAPAYRLGPEAPYPAALDDAYATLLWLRESAGDLGVREDQIAVAGNSAGGGLAAAVTLLARDRGEVAVAFHMPLYPMIDDRCTTASARENNAPVWDAVTNRNAWRVYLGPMAGSDDVPAYAAPARATDLTGLPPTFSYVGDLEPLRDEVVGYMERLSAAGVDVAFEVYRGCYHGFDVVAPRAGVSRRALAAQATWLRMAASTYSAAQPLSAPGRELGHARTLPDTDP
jgi:acetyl esterase/lipase